MWVADKRVELYAIMLDARDIALIIQWYAQIPGISVSDLVYILYYDNPPRFHSHTQLVYGKIPMTQIYGTAESHSYKSTSSSELLHGKELQ